jgi:hypothetical protein
MKSFALLCLTLTTSICFAGPLDQPAAKPVPTIRSEIKRGDDAASLALDKIEHLLDIANAFKALINDNEAKNTNTDAFLLGAYYEYWEKVSIYTKAYDELLSPAEKTYGRRIVQSSYKTFREKQTALGLDDAAFAGALCAEGPYTAKFIQRISDPLSILGK